MVNDHDPEEASPDKASKETGESAEEIPSGSPWKHHADKEPKQEDMAVLEGEDWIELKVFGLHESEASLVKTKHYAACTRCKGYVVAGTAGAYLQASGAEMNAITDCWRTRRREVLDIHR